MLIMSRIRLMVTMVLACLSIAGSGSARGEFLVGSNLGMSSPFNPSNTYVLSGNQVSSGVGFNYAVRFTQEGAESATFQQAQLALSYRGGMNLIDVVLM